MTQALWDLIQGDCDIDAIKTVSRHVEIGEGLQLDGWNPVHYLCDNPVITADVRENALAFFLQHYPGFCDHVDENGCTPLHLLCKNKGHTELSGSLNLLLSTNNSKIYANLTDSQDMTPLHLLCSNSSAMKCSALETLLRSGADISMRDRNGNSPLHHLAENGIIACDCLQIMCKYGADWNAMNEFSMGAFHYLCQNNRISSKMLETAFKHKADPNKLSDIGSTPLHYLCQNENLNVSLMEAYLANKSTNVTIRNSLGKIAFDEIPECKKDCKKYVREFSAPQFGLRNSLSADALGGEDPSDLPSSLQHTLIKWNESLPPFDMAFYTAICCDATFESTYKSLQIVSVQLLDDPNDQSVLTSWKVKLANWRKQILVAYAALVRPTIWIQEASSRLRSVPLDLQAIQAEVDLIWKKYPGPSQTLQRLSMVQPLLQNS